MYKAVIYDLDGTIMNTLNMNMYPLLRIIEEELHEIWCFEDVIKFWSYPGMKVMEELNIKNKEEVYARWVRYVNEYEEGATLYDGILETFEALFSKTKQAIVTSKKRKQFEIDFISKGLDRYMDAMIVEEDTEKHKPDPEPLLVCLKQLNVSPQEAIYIGDAYTDYLAAMNAGMTFGYAKWGSLTTFEMEKGIILEKPEQLIEMINSAK